jgi:long-chain acyl-CoA synthetase
MFLDFAVQQIGALLTPIYPTINVNELEFVLNDAQVKVVFVNDEETFHKVVSIQNNVPSLKAIFTFEHVANARHWKEVVALASPESIGSVKTLSDKITYDDLPPSLLSEQPQAKGVMVLSHRNISSNVKALFLPPPGTICAVLVFFPSIIFERITFSSLSGRERTMPKA